VLGEASLQLHVRVARATPVEEFEVERRIVAALKLLPHLPCVREEVHLPGAATTAHRDLAQTEGLIEAPQTRVLQKGIVEDRGP